MIGQRPDEYSLRELVHAVCGRWYFEADVLRQTVGGLFSKEAAKTVRNPYETRGRAPLTPEQQAEIETASTARLEAQRRVNERRFKALQEAEQRGTGRG